MPDFGYTKRHWWNEDHYVPGKRKWYQLGMYDPMWITFTWCFGSLVILMGIFGILYSQGYLR